MHRKTSAPTPPRVVRPTGTRAAATRIALSVAAMAASVVAASVMAVSMMAASRPPQQPPPQQPSTQQPQSQQPAPARGQQRDPRAQTFAAYCAGCHGTTLAGGRAPTLLDDAWRYGGDDASVRQSIRDGRPGTEMPAFRTLLKDEQIDDLIAYVRAQAARAQKSAARARSPVGQVVRTEQGSVRLELVADGLATPWGLAFLPDGRLLVTERPGRLRVIEPIAPRAGAPAWRLRPEPIAGTPAVWAHQDGGLLDVAAHPDYARNGWIYLSYAEPGPDDTSMTAIVRGRLAADGRWIDQQTLYHAPPALFTASNAHYGSRFLFDAQGHLFYTIGDRDRARDAQDLSRPTGKIHRIDADGTIPRDNPFVSRARALGTIWSYGHRHPQGLAIHPVTGKLWATEHGPVGGDELNRIEPGHNYGWPLVSSGQIMPPLPEAPATGDAADAPVSGARPHTAVTMDGPIVQWTPAIAPSGITFYRGTRVPAWTNSLFVSGLGGEALRRLQTEGDTVVHEEIVFSGFGRVRAVVSGPDGYLYVALNVPGVGLSDTTPGMIIRLVPTTRAPD